MGCSNGDLARDQGFPLETPLDDHCEICAWIAGCPRSVFPVRRLTLTEEFFVTSGRHASSLVVRCWTQEAVCARLGNSMPDPGS